jgi:hypothetical protein
VPNACKSNAECLHSEWRTAEDHVGTCPLVGDNSAKAVLSPHTLAFGEENGNVREEGPAAHQVVGGVTAHRADDG